MSIPLDRLYTYLHGICNHDVIIYRVYPYGSKNITDCTPLKLRSWYEDMTLPHAWCLDQELIPSSWANAHLPFFYFDEQMIKTSRLLPLFKAYSILPYRLHDRTILVHSEFGSKTVKTMQNHGYIPVHWFSHGAIAQDWFRYAEHDPKIGQQNSSNTKKFLIYNRAWTGTREYRLKFAAMLAETGLLSVCKTSVAFTDSGTHYSQHRFQNSQWSIDLKLEDYFDENLYTSCASADYDQDDYAQRIIEVVLETIFDDSKISLTEKSLRPMATGTPFILASAAGSLAYLRRYGFETFTPWINESYDLESDPATRLQMIIQELQRISKLKHADYQLLIDQCYKIAAKNRQHFFSQNFFNSVIGEYQQGMTAAIEESRHYISDHEWQLVKQQHSEIQQQQIQDFLQRNRISSTGK